MGSGWLWERLSSALFSRTWRDWMRICPFHDVGAYSVGVGDDCRALRLGQVYGTGDPPDYRDSKLWYRAGYYSTI